MHNIPVSLTFQEHADLLELIQRGQRHCFLDVDQDEHAVPTDLFHRGEAIALKLHRAQIAATPVVNHPHPVTVIGSLLRRDTEHIELRGHELPPPRRAAFLPGANP